MRQLTGLMSVQLHTLAVRVDLGVDTGFGFCCDFAGPYVVIPIDIPSCLTTWPGAFSGFFAGGNGGSGGENGNLATMVGAAPGKWPLATMEALGNPVHLEDYGWKRPLGETARLKVENFPPFKFPLKTLRKPKESPLWLLLPWLHRWVGAGPGVPQV